jgi:hypothetical protein
MKVEFKETFFESVEKLVWYDTKLWKIWEFIRRGIPTFFGNIWRFRKELYSHQWWDYRYTLEMLRRSLSIMVDKLEKDGMEVESSKGKKVAKIRRAVELLGNKINDNFIERAEAQLGNLILRDWEFEATENGAFRIKDSETADERKHNTSVYKLAQKIEDSEWKELWVIFKGKDLTKFKKSGKEWDEWFDGSDMRGWWD